MPRWSTTAAEALHLAEMATLLGGGVMAFTLKNGTYIEGVLRKSKVGNNSGAGQLATAYCGSATIDTLLGQVELDLLDVKDVAPVAVNRLGEYEQAGLIKLVDPPSRSDQLD